MKISLSCWDVLLVTQEPQKVLKSMSQNGDPKMAVSIAIYSIEGLDVGFWGGSISIYVCVYIYMSVHMYTYIPYKRRIV